MNHIHLVKRQLTHDWLRTALTLIVVGAVIGVILVLEGLEAGLYDQVRKVVHDRGGDLIVAQAGVSNMTAARSVIPQFVRAEIEAIPDVSVAHPITQLQVIYEQGGQRTAVFLNVYDTAGAPESISAGTAITQNREILIHESIAHRFGLAPGDPFVLSDYAFTISGLLRDSAAIFTPFAFVTYDGLLDFYFEADLAGDIATFPLLSFLLIELDPDAAAETVAAEIERRVPEVDVFTPGQLAANDENLIRALFGPVIRLLVAVSYAIGILVVGIFMFASVVRRLRQFGVMKALGFRNRDLFGVVLLEAAVTTAIAVPVGIGAAAVLAAVIQWAWPLYLVLPLESVPLLRTISAAVLFAFLGALIPLRAILRADPAEAFQS